MPRSLAEFRLESVREGMGQLFAMRFDGLGDEPFLKVAESLGELELALGKNARPAIAQVRADLTEAMAKRQAGDAPAALSLIRRAMARLSALGGELDPSEGAMMRLVAERFSQALTRGDKSTAKDAVNIMRHKAGDQQDEKKDDW
jgi:hypothetical protein